MPNIRAFCQRYMLELRIVCGWIDIYAKGGSFDRLELTPLDAAGIDVIHAVHVTVRLYSCFLCNDYAFHECYSVLVYVGQCLF